MKNMIIHYLNIKLRKENVKIICNIHGIFEQTPSNHMTRFGCTQYVEI